ncbi:hypothetical protein D3C85_107910 [compost metagenome]
MNPLSNPVPNTDEVKNAFEVLAKAFEEDLPRVQEEVFRTTILPMILSKEPIKSYEPWLRHSDSVLRPITVWRGNEFLFKCPAIGRPLNLHKSRGSRDSMFEHISKAMQKDDIVPKLGQRYLKNVLVARVKNGVLDPKEIAEWRTVFKFYNVTAFTDAPVEGGSAPAPVAAPLDNGDFLSDDYDLA